jgi:hypothetical protein
VDAGPPDAGVRDAGRPGDVCLDASGALCWELPLSGKFDLNAAAFDGAALWAVGEHGTVVRFVDGRWSNVPGLTSESLQGVIVGDTGLTVVGANGTILHEQRGWKRETPRDPGDRYGAVWTDGRTRVIAGTQCNVDVVLEDRFDAGWIPWSFAEPERFGCERRVALGGSTLGTLTAAGEQGLVLRRVTPGDWEPVDAGAHDWTGVCGQGAETWLLATDGTLARAQADGSWAQASVPSPSLALACLPDGGAWVASASDGGSELSRCDALSACTSAGELGFTVRAVTVATPSVQFAVGALGGVGVAADGGAWTTLSVPPGAVVRDFARDPAGPLYAVGSGAFARRRGTDGWHLLVRTADSTQDFNAIAFASAGHAYVVATNGRVYQLVDGILDMSSFGKVLSAGAEATPELVDVAKFGEQMIAVGERGVVALHAVASSSLLWTAVRQPLAGQAFLRKVAVVGDEAVAVGDRGQMLRVRHDGGILPVQSGLTADITSIVGLGPGHFVVLAGGALYEGVDGGLVDLKLPTGLGELHALAGSSTKELWLASGSGDLVRWDGGTLDRWNVSEGSGSGTNLTAVLPESGGVFVGGQDAIVRLAR